VPLPDAAAWAGMTLCSSDSACMRSLDRVWRCCNVRTSEPRSRPSRTSFRVARERSSSTGRARITVNVYEQTWDSE
jgi:hypothetical protein